MAQSTVVRNVKYIWHCGLLPYWRRSVSTQVSSICRAIPRAATTTAFGSVGNRAVSPHQRILEISIYPPPTKKRNSSAQTTCTRCAPGLAWKTRPANSEKAAIRQGLSQVSPATRCALTGRPQEGQTQVQSSKVLKATKNELPAYAQNGSLRQSPASQHGCAHALSWSSRVQVSLVSAYHQPPKMRRWLP